MKKKEGNGESAFSRVLCGQLLTLYAIKLEGKLVGVM